MRFARLSNSADLDSALLLVEAARRLGLARVWLEAGSGLVDPREVAAALPEPALPLVLWIDPADDQSLPPGSMVEPAIEGAAGWVDSIEAFATGRRAWVVAADVGTVAAAARAGVGAAFGPFENPDSAEDWTAEYEAELAGIWSRAATGEVNPSCAAFVDLPDDLGEAVGIVERYRAAGIDEVVLRGVNAYDEQFVGALMAEFDDDEVRRDQLTRAERIAPAIERMQQRSEIVNNTMPQNKKPSRSFSSWMRKRQEAIAMKMSDRQLAALVGNSAGIRFLFKTMAARYQPRNAPGFEGEIEFTLHHKKRTSVGTIVCSPTGGSYREGPSSDANLRVEAQLTDFLRVAVGKISAPSAVVRGELNVRGDYALALQMGEMFGGPPIL